MSSRRQFILQSCKACLGISALGLLAASCSTTQAVWKASISNDRIQVPLSEFNSTNGLLVKNKSLDYDILLVKKEGNFTALKMQCTHNDFPLNYNGNKIVCNSHGSQFALDGKVLLEPASRSLTQYKTTTDSQFITIFLKQTFTS